MLVIIPPDKLKPEVLENIIESFVLREGTDYGECEQGLESKVLQVMSQIKSSEVLIVFEEESESINLIHKRDYDEAI